MEKEVSDPPNLFSPIPHAIEYTGSIILARPFGPVGRPEPTAQRMQPQRDQQPHAHHAPRHNPCFQSTSPLRHDKTSRRFGKRRPETRSTISKNEAPDNNLFRRPACKAVPNGRTTQPGTIMLDQTRRGPHRLDSESVVLQEKLTALATMTSGVSHEFNNANCIIRCGMDNLVRHLDEFHAFLLELVDERQVELKKRLLLKFKAFANLTDMVRIGSQRIEAVVDNLKVFTHLDCAEQTHTDLANGLQATVALLSADAGTINLRTDIDKQLGVYGKPAQLNQVFMNLLGNAVWAVRESGVEDGRIEITAKKTGDRIAVTISDNGVGIDAETTPKIFDAFFTTHKVGGGMGLGLFISQKIIADHRGQIIVDSIPGQGTQFTVILPATPSHPSTKDKLPQLRTPCDP